MVAIVSPSWGGPSVFPWVYENGLAVLREWGLEIREYPSARADAGFLRAHPEFRAKDLNDAFADPDIKAVFASIGGDDSVRILRFLDKDVIAKNPKIVMGYSDTTTIHAYCHLLGLVTFNGPSVIAGFSQMESLPASFREHVRSMLFDPADSYTYVPFDSYSDGYPDWSVPENLGKVKEPRHSDGWRILQGGWYRGRRIVRRVHRGVGVSEGDGVLAGQGFLGQENPFFRDVGGQAVVGSGQVYAHELWRARSIRQGVRNPVRASQGVFR